jgi:hypothetical protein
MFFSAAATGRRTILLTFENTSGSKVRLALPAPPPNRWLVFAHSAVSSARLALDGGPGEELFLIEPECLTGGSVGTDSIGSASFLRILNHKLCTSTRTIWSEHRPVSGSAGDRMRWHH